MPKVFTREDLINVVVNLRQPNAGTGTGVFIEHNGKPYLVTASHVANDMLVNCEFIVRGANDIPISMKLPDFINGFSGMAIPWKHHPIADISVLELNPTQNALTKLAGRFLPSENIYNGKVAVSRNIELTSMGFPLGLGAVGHFSPLTFRTFAASGFITLPRFDTKVPCDFFILENPTIGGYSGGPIFDISIYTHGAMTSYGPGTLIYGITHGTISDQTGGKLGAITPSHFIFDLI